MALCRPIRHPSIAIGTPEETRTLDPLNRAASLEQLSVRFDTSYLLHRSKSPPIQRSGIATHKRDVACAHSL